MHCVLHCNCIYAKLVDGAALGVVLACRAPVGYLGDAPAWSFHGPKERRPATAGGSMSMCCPLAPTSAAAPGPAAYTTQLSSFGRQVCDVLAECLVGDQWVRTVP